MDIEDIRRFGIELEPAYEAEPGFIEPFWEFMYRFQSLERHWNLNKGFINFHVLRLKNFRKRCEGEDELWFSETAEADIEFFPEYLRLSTISFSLSLVENLLGELSEEIAADLNVKIDLSKKQIPYINKYILWLVRGCGITIDIDKSLWKSLDAIRALRNQFIHRIGRDIPEQIKKTISEMVDTPTIGGEITDAFVDESFVKLSELVKTIELAYISYIGNSLESKST